MPITTIATKTEFAKSVIKDAVDKHKEKVAVSCSFGKDSIVVLHLALQVKKDIPVFTVTTKYFPRETFDYKDRIMRLWNFKLKEYKSEKYVDPNLKKTNPDKCCYALKVEPTKQAVKNLNGWITGLRNTEGRTRKDYSIIEENGSLIKYNPILSWTELDVWKYIAIYQIPVHPWYKLGYRSLDCAPCTHLISDDQGEREGRWMGTSKCGGECGIHTKILKR